MSISCRELYDRVAEELGAGYGNDRVEKSFVSAMNSALDQLSVKADKATKFTHISSVDDEVTGIDNHYGYILYSGVMYWMIRMGHKARDPRIAPVQMADSTELWKQSQADYVMDVDNILQSDTTADIIGLGYVSSTDTSENTD